MDTNSAGMLTIYREHLELATKIRKMEFWLGGARVAVKRDAASETYMAGGKIIIPDTEIKKKPVCGTVVAIGQDNEKIIEYLGEAIAVGWRVTFSPYGGVGAELYVDGNDTDPTLVEAINVTDIQWFWSPELRGGTP